MAASTAAHQRPPNDVVPARCPACGSHDLTTASKRIDVSTYWRCVACGEIWNAGRREQGQRFAPTRR